MSETPAAENGLRTIRYTDGTDAVLVAVPWDYHTGLIPPPTITFGSRTFACDGNGPRIFPPAERDHGLPFAPPENEEPTCPTCGQPLFTHGIVGRCIPPGEADGDAWADDGGYGSDSDIPPGGQP